MDWNKYLYDENEKPLDRLVTGYSYTSIFRRIGFIGDSLSSGEFETLDADGKKHFHDLYEYSWGQYIARKNGLVGFNFSRGGLTAKGYMEIFADEKGFWDPELACQAYVIALGVNDIFNRGMEIGSVDEDVDPSDYRNNKPTYIGYYAQIVARYKEISPDAKFFFVTFPPHESEKRETLGAIAIKELYRLAEVLENCYVIDLHEYSPVRNAEFAAKFHLGGHLNPMGYIFTAELIDSYIDYIVRHNPEDFKYAGLINSGIKYK